MAREPLRILLSRARVTAFVRSHRPTVVYAFLALIVLTFHAFFHEPWRDETQALLIGRETSLADMLHVLRYEAHPPLLHVVLKIFDAALPTPWPLALIAGIGYFALLTGTHAFFMCFTRSRAWAMGATCVFAATYMYSYELGVVARAYGLGSGLGLWALAYFHRALVTSRWRDVMYASICAALSAITSAGAAVFMAVAIAVFVVAWIINWKAIYRLFPIAITAPSFWLVRDCISPLPDRQRDFEAITQPFNYEQTRAATEKWFREIFGWGSTNGWWHTDMDPDVFVFVRECFYYALILCLLLNIVRLIREWRTEFFLPVVALGQVVAFFYLIYYRGTRPDYRHWTAVFIAISATMVGMCLAGEGRRKIVWARRACLLFIAPWIGVQITVAYSNWSQDLTNPFSLTKTFALALPPHARVVSDEDSEVTSVPYWAPTTVMRSSMGQGRYYSFVRWDKQRFDRRSLRSVVMDECTFSTSGLIYSFGSPGDLPGRCIDPIAPPYEGKRARTDEYPQSYRVRCNCLGK